MGMSPCPTGWCGHPCTCPESYSHTGESEAKAVIGILQQRLSDIGAKEAEKKHGEPMKAYRVSKISLRAIQYNGELYEVDHFLHTDIHDDPQSRIYTYSGIVSTTLTDGVWTFEKGLNDRAHVQFRYEIVNYKGTVSVSCGALREHDTYINAYLAVTESETYLPKEAV